MIRAVVDGGGKVQFLGALTTSGDFLFDLELADPEANNLAQVHTEVAAELDSELQAWLGALRKRPEVRRRWLRKEKRLYRTYLDEVGR